MRLMRFWFGLEIAEARGTQLWRSNVWKEGVCVFKKGSKKKENAKVRLLVLVFIHAAMFMTLPRPQLWPRRTESGDNQTPLPPVSGFWVTPLRAQAHRIRLECQTGPDYGGPTSPPNRRDC